MIDGWIFASGVAIVNGRKQSGIRSGRGRIVPCILHDAACSASWRQPLWRNMPRTCGGRAMSSSLCGRPRHAVPPRPANAVPFGRSCAPRREAGRPCRSRGTPIDLLPPEWPILAPAGGGGGETRTAGGARRASSDDGCRAGHGIGCSFRHFRLRMSRSNRGSNDIDLPMRQRCRGQ